MNRRSATASRPRTTSGSGTSAERFAAKVRARRRRRVGQACGVALLLLAIGWAAVLSPWGTVRRVEVVGASRVDVEAVRDAGHAELGRPLVLADTDAVAVRVRELRLVRTATVARRWPSALRVTVVERVAVAAVPVGADDRDGFALVDVDGVQLSRAVTVPAGLPVLKLDLTKAGAPALRACLQVLGSLPTDLSGRLRRVGAESADGVWFVLADGAKVTWGSAEQNARKAQVLQVLLKQEAAAYDVSAPDNPAVVARR